MSHGLAGEGQNQICSVGLKFPILVIVTWSGIYASLFVPFHLIWKNRTLPSHSVDSYTASKMILMPFPGIECPYWGHECKSMGKGHIEELETITWKVILLSRHNFLKKKSNKKKDFKGDLLLGRTSEIHVKKDPLNLAHWIHILFMHIAMHEPILLKE